MKTKEQPYVTKRQPTEKFNPNPDMGLTSRQAQFHALHGWINTPVEPPSKTLQEIITSNTFTYFNLIFAVLSFLLILVGSFRNLTFLPVIIANTIVGIVQEIRSKKILDRLTMLNEPKIKVVRDGKTQILPAEKLVLEDIVIFNAGNQICADATVMSGDVQVNEALITGESDEVTKKPGDALLSGSFIVSGQCRARLDKVGIDSYVSQLTVQAKTAREGEQSEMIRSLDKLVKCVGILIIPIGLLLFGLSFFVEKNGFRLSVTSMVAAVIGMIPEGLYLLATVALVVSVIRLAKQNVLVHDMKCIETLARVDVLCVDKTGTITENTMRVAQLISLDAPYMLDTPLELLIGDFVQSMRKDNITMAALQEYFTKGSGSVPLRITSFSSEFKYSSAEFENVSYVLGAPEFILREDYGKYKKVIESYGKEGYRVLIFARYEGHAEGRALDAPAIPYGYILLSNPVRREAKSTFEYFAQQGVAIKVISGDNALTVSRVSEEAGIQNARNYVDATTLTTPEALEQAALYYTVFGRVTPSQKRQLIQALKNAGHTVAMTGDGVNDVLALKDADCSIAMASGSDAAAQVAQLVLLNSNFSCMPSVVLEGRRVVNNIQRSASLFLVKNIFSFLLSIFSVVFMITYPLEPSQISLISMFTIGIPAFFLALEPNKNIIRGHFLTNVLLKALPAGLTDFVVVGALVIFGQVFEVDPVDISTAATMLLAIVGFMILYRISAPMDKIRWSIFSGSIAGLLFSAVFLSELFAIYSMSKKCIMLLIVFSIVTEPLLRYSWKATEFIREFFIEKREEYNKKKLQN